MVRRVVAALLAIFIAVAFLASFVWAPIVPYERQVFVEAATSPDLCPGTQICATGPVNAWVRSYASLAYDAFGFGTPPFVGPVSVEKNGIVTAFVFNGTEGFSALHSVQYPVSSPEPIPLLRINGLTIYPNGAPFGGTITQISVTNLGVGETVLVSWGNGAQGSPELPAGATGLFNSTDWTGGPLPRAHSNYVVTVYAEIHYAKFWLNGWVTQTVEVTYAS